ncbi:MAG: LysR family transcriptional regulator [Gammaproteobacteria bacterium]|nr:LysR family transcriptional regulator [Gammaproteobacteria bacterium]
MDIASLQAFVTVAEYGSFSRASEKLYVTQPAVSKRIASLESELGIHLFDRIGHNINLTEAGTALLPRARSILMEIEDSRRTIANLSGDVGGKLSIGTSHHIGLHRLPPVLRQFSREYPKVALDLHFMASEEACKAISHGELELGIVTLPLEMPAELNSREIWPDPLVVVASFEHPLAIENADTLAQLLAFPAIMPEQGTYTRQTIEHAIVSTGQQLTVGMSTNYLETIKMMVSIGMGWSVLPETMLTDDLCVLNITELSISRRLGIIWHRQRTLSNAATKMINALN